MREFRTEKVPLPKDFRPFWRAGVPFDVEIGCGVGFHPLHYARLHPERHLVAFERTKEKFAKFQGRIQGHDPIPNLTPIHGDAIPWIAHGLTRESVDRYFLLYPNPYPKESQSNLRFYRMPFFAHLRETLKRGGTLTLATNEAFYASEAREEIPYVWGMEIVEDRALSSDEKPRTHFEKKYLARGELCRNLVFRKN